MKALAAPVGFRPSATSKFSAPTVDQVMVEERAASFGKRSIKTSAKIAGLKMAVSMCDLTTLEGKDTPGKVAYLCRKALQPIEAKYDVPLLRRRVRLSEHGKIRAQVSWRTFRQ
jgi:hypothetical protein